MSDNFFTDISNTNPYLKIGFMGWSGSGKTYTASGVAVGLHGLIKSTKPIFAQDTERAITKIKPIFSEHGVAVKIRESRALSDFQTIVKRMRDGESDIFLLDSISHLWINFVQSYKEKKSKEYLDVRDRAYLNEKWQREFSEVFVNAPCHIIMCGRAGFEYVTEKDEETGKVDFYKDDIKMDAGKNVTFEPDLVIYMEKVKGLLDNKIEGQKSMATVVKDRSTLIDNSIFYYERGTKDSKDHKKNVQKIWKDFGGAINEMIANPEPKEMQQGNDGQIFSGDDASARDMKVEHTRWLEEIQGLLLSAFPSTGADDKKKKTDMIEYGFATRSWTAVELNSVDGLKAGYNRIKDKLIADGVLKSMLIVE